MLGMTISLTPEQQAWLSAHVARGDFASVEDAARQLIDERIAERAIEEHDDLAWAKPHVDEALARSRAVMSSAVMNIAPAMRLAWQR